MIVLGIETATEHLSAALFIEPDTVYERYEPSRSSHCELLTQFMFELTQEAGIYFDQVDSIAVSAGPGSFTGLRIGIATGMGLAYGLGIPAYGVNTLMGLALNIGEHGTLVCPVIDAKRSEVYTAFYRTTAGIPETVLEPLTVPLSRLAELATQFNEQVIITGPASALLMNALSEQQGGAMTIASHRPSNPTAVSIAKLGCLTMKSGITLQTCLLKPLYLKRSDAEIARDAGKSSFNIS